MKIDIITLFPKIFKSPFSESIIKRAQEKELIKIKVHDLRKWTKDKHKTVDDRPYGGGAGMLLMIDPVYKALKDLRKKNSKVILLTPKGKTYNQNLAQNFSKEKHLILIAGHYEGFDQRIHDYLADKEISVGNYILTGGELPTMVLVDSIVRLIPDVIDPESLKDESFSITKNIEYPQYTRPENFKGWKVPKILLSGNHAEIEKWKKENSKDM